MQAALIALLSVLLICLFLLLCLILSSTIWPPVSVLGLYHEELFMRESVSSKPLIISMTARPRWCYPFRSGIWNDRQRNSGTLHEEDLITVRLCSSFSKCTNAFISVHACTVGNASAWISVCVCRICVRMHPFEASLYEYLSFKRVTLIFLLYILFILLNHVFVHSREYQ